MNLSISTSQLGLDPLLDTLTLEDGQLVIADESFESAFLGMATPMSEIPVWLLWLLVCLFACLLVCLFNGDGDGDGDDVKNGENDYGSGTN